MELVSNNLNDKFNRNYTSIQSNELEEAMMDYDGSEKTLDYLDNILEINK